MPQPISDDLCSNSTLASRNLLLYGTPDIKPLISVMWGFVLIYDLMMVTGRRHRYWMDIGIHAEPDQHDSLWTLQSGDRGGAQSVGGSDILHRICPIPQSTYYRHLVCPWSKALSCVCHEWMCMFTLIFITYISEMKIHTQLFWLLFDMFSL